jgi:glycosyltransferase involved in cell wall biosynthesis
MASRLVERVSGLRRPPVVVPNGTDLDRFVPVDRAAARDRAGIPKDAIVFLYAGPLEFRKGVHLLPGAFAHVAKEHPTAMLVLAGGDHPTAPGSGSMRRWLEMRLEAEGVDDRTVLLGCVSYDRMPEVYGIADLLVAPSYGEAFGNVLVEALACGLPVIATREGAAAEVVRDGETGILVPRGDGPALADAMRAAVSDLATLSAASRDARVEAVSRFDRKLMAQRTVAVYRDVLEGAARGGSTLAGATQPARATEMSQPGGDHGNRAAGSAGTGVRSRAPR